MDQARLSVAGTARGVFQPTLVYLLLLSFLYATLIFGLAATTVPIVLHLLARREPRKVVFPSIHFLTKRFESNRSRLRVRRWWLLALRIAALAALALVLARPVIHQSLSITWLTIVLVALLGIALLVMASVSLSRGESRAMTYGLCCAAAAALLLASVWASLTYARGPTMVIDNVAPVSIAIVIDNSPTSAWKTPADDRTARIQDLASWMVAQLPRTSRIAIVDRSPKPATFALDVASALSKIEQLRPLEVTQPIASRIDAAARLVRSSDLPNRQILLITDLAESTWDDASQDAGLVTLLSQDPPVSLTVFDLGDFDGINRSLSIPRFGDATPPRGSPIAVSTMLQLAAGDGTASVSVTAELQMYKNDPALPRIRDGKVIRPSLRSVDRTSVRVAPGGSSDLLMTIPSLEVGTHHGQIGLVGADAIGLDDTRYFTLEVLPPARVLLVGDDEDEARVISQAITAAPGMVDSSNAEYLVERIGYADLAVVRLSDFDAIIMLDPRRDVLSDAAVTQFIGGGGGILVCLGPAAGDNGTDSSFVPKLVRRWRVPQPGSFFQVVNTSHPVTQALAVDTPWSDFRVHQYWQLAPEENDSVLIQYAGTAHAALVERLLRADGSEAAGRVLVLSTPLPALSAGTRAWNDLFTTDAWPAWLLTRRSVEQLTGRHGAALMTLVGSPQLIRLEPEPDEETAKRRRIQLFPPRDAAPVPLNVPPDAEQVVAGDTSHSGTYWLRGAALGAGFSVNVPNSAIGLERIAAGRLDQVFGPDQYSLAITREEIQFAENKSGQQVPLYSAGMLLALAVFLLEQVLGNRFYRRS
jgi:hypothetical protein